VSSSASDQTTPIPIDQKNKSISKDTKDEDQTPPKNDSIIPPIIPIDTNKN